MNKKTRYAQALLAARQAAGFEAAKDFAKKLGVDASTVSRWENGNDDKWPTPGHLDKAISLLLPEGKSAVLHAYFHENKEILSAIQPAKPAKPEGESMVGRIEELETERDQALQIVAEMQAAVANTPPEISAILEHFRRFCDVPECLSFLTVAGRVMFRAPVHGENGDSDRKNVSGNEQDAGKRIRRIFLAFSECMKKSPGVSANEHAALERLTAKNIQ